MKVIDMHCDTILALENDQQGCLRRNELNVDLMKMQQGHYMLQNFAMFVHLRENEDPCLKAQQLIDRYYNELEKNKDIIQPVFCYEDILAHEKQGIMSAMLTLEEGAVAKDLSMLRNYYRLGVRMITLTWNFANGIGHPNFQSTGHYEDMFHINTTDGLTPYGIAYVQEMERLNMIIDVSHLSDAGFYDVYAHTTKPFVASHSNARQICRAARNMSDDMILKLASRGGVMGINFCGDFLREKPGGHARSCVDDMVKHILYIRNLAGIDCIGLGSDFDGIENNLEIENCGQISKLHDALLEAGLTQEEVDKIFYKNVLRVYREILK